VSQSCGPHRVPRAGVDRMIDPADALALISLVVSSPPRGETIVVVLDRDHRGRTVANVDGTEHDDDVLTVVERFAAALAEERGGHALVIATVRVGRGADPDDGARWLEASDLADDYGVELVEWFVVELDHTGAARHVSCPRALLAEPPRWKR
jgi:hypothetical protein